MLGVDENNLVLSIHINFSFKRQAYSLFHVFILGMVISNVGTQNIQGKTVCLLLVIQILKFSCDK